MLTRRSFIAAGAAALAPGRGIAAAVPRPRRIAMVLPRADVGDAVGFQAYLNATELPVDYVRYIVGTDQQEIRAALADIRATRPDLVFSVFTQISQELAGPDGGETPLGDIPLVFSSVTDPVAAGMVARLDTHGRNLTGTRHIAPVESQLKVMGSYRAFDRLGVIYNAQEPNMLATLAELRRNAAAFGYALVDRALPLDAAGEPRADALPQLVAEVAREGADFLYIGPDSVVASRSSGVVAEAALTHRLPTFCATELPIRTANVLFGLVSRAYNVGGLAGHKAYQILADNRPAAAVPIETLQRFTLMLRMSVAKELRFFPPILLLKMAEVNTEPLAAGRRGRTG